MIAGITPAADVAERIALKADTPIAGASKQCLCSTLIAGIHTDEDVCFSGPMAQVFHRHR
jgi:hypothetical protein